jgi:hypothetical protein
MVVQNNDASGESIGANCSMLSSSGQPPGGLRKSMSNVPMYVYSTRKVAVQITRLATDSQISDSGELLDAGMAEKNSQHSFSVQRLLVHGDSQRSQHFLRSGHSSIPRRS